MANVFCSSTGSNTAPYETWAKAATTFATAVGAASTSGDIIAVDAVNPPADIAANTTWTFLANVSVIASTNSGTSTITPTTMGTSAYLGAGGATSYSINLAGAYKVYFYGITFRIAGSTNQSIQINITSGGHFELESCYLWLGTTTSSTAVILLGASSSNVRSSTITKNCTFRFGHVNHRLQFAGAVEIYSGLISTGGASPSTLFNNGNTQYSCTLYGTDLSHITGTLVPNTTSTTPDYRFVQCKLGAAVTVLATQTAANKSGARAWIVDCSSGDTHGLFGYYDALGSVVSNTGIKYTSGAASQSWEVVTTANCSYSTPFTTPWVNFYHSGTSAITPWFEVLRDGNATAYTDAQVWGEFGAKVTAGSTAATLYHDRQALVDWAGGTAGASQASGTDTWDGENATHWAGKVDSGSALTPAETGDIRGRVVVGAPSITVYVDPYIRT